MTIRQEAAEADAKGLIKFISTVPCKNCGKFERYVSSKRCASCDIQDATKYYEDNQERCKKTQKEWVKSNKVYVSKKHASRYQMEKLNKIIDQKLTQMKVELKQIRKEMKAVS